MLDSTWDARSILAQNRSHCFRLVRLCCFASLWLVVLDGCKEPIAYRALPAPVQNETNYEIVGRIHREWGGDNFEFCKSDELHFISLRGVDTPKPGQPYFYKALRALRNLRSGKDVRIHVFRRDESMVKVADAFVINPDPADIQGDLNLGLELIRIGFGWYDGEEFEGSKVYREAEAEARKHRFGIWSQDNPIPPWEFEEQRRTQSQSKLKSSD